tara:strand:+ start:353 stop:547 length:195 start_codon:yes stop_codon:yes gene_type:complete
MSANRRRRKKKLSALNRRRRLSAIKLSTYLPVKIVSIETIILLLIVEIVLHCCELAFDIAQHFL